MKIEKSLGPLIPSRVSVGILGCLGCTLVFILRSNLSVAIIAMVDKSEDNHRNEDMGGTDVCFVKRFNSSDNNSLYKGKYLWNQSIQGIIMGSYFYGYTITQISGSFADKFGAKWLCGLGVFLPSICNALIPVFSDIHYSLIIIMRLMIGVFHGVVYSSIFSLFSKWFPQSEKNLAISGTIVAGNLGGVVIMPLSGYLSQIHFMDGWPIIFYFTSVIHVFWFILWCKYVSNSPEENLNISANELNYILKNNPNSRYVNNISIPWKAIFTSRPVWASTIAKSTGNFGYYLLCTKMPQYLDSVFGITIHTNSWFNSLMYITISLSLLIGGPLSECIRRRGLISQTRNRKNFQSFAMFGCALCLISIPVMNCNREAVIALLLLSMFIYGFITGGEYSNPTEIAPNFSGTVYGLANTLASTTGFVGPLIVGFLLESGTTSEVRHNWNIIWYITAAIYVFGGIFFEIFGSAEPHSWAIVNDPVLSSDLNKISVISYNS